MRWLDEHESEQTLGDVEGQGSLACCSPSGRKESDKTETELTDKAFSYFRGCYSLCAFTIARLLKIQCEIDLRFLLLLLEPQIKC